MPFGNFFTDSETHPRPFILTPAMQTLKRFEDPCNVFFIKTDPVILYSNSPKSVSAQIAGYFDLGRIAFFIKFQSVANQVLKQSSDLRWVYL